MPGQASAAPGVSSVRHQEIVNRADGSRMESFNDSKAAGTALATIRAAVFDKRVVVGWELERRSDSTWVIRSEEAGLCLQPTSTAAVGVAVSMENCDGSAAQSWKIVPESTNTGAEGATGWWSLRPAGNTRLAAAVDTVGGAYSTVSLYRATNSADRLWHHEDPGQSW
ncbi:RICIN domain-containing protein [Streptomyces sp. NPDC059398]|uniref:RICIN domain-containing protein n=1 Tax=Streptomyces sp. NPDC059398 TaxID=3346820 RepID=UPI00368FFA32